MENEKKVGLTILFAKPAAKIATKMVEITKATNLLPRRSFLELIVESTKFVAAKATLGSEVGKEKLENPESDLIAYVTGTGENSLAIVINTSTGLANVWTGPAKETTDFDLGTGDETPAIVMDARLLASQTLIVSDAKKPVVEKDPEDGVTSTDTVLAFQTPFEPFLLTIGNNPKADSIEEAKRIVEEKTLGNVGEPSAVGEIHINTDNNGNIQSVYLTVRANADQIQSEQISTSVIPLYKMVANPQDPNSVQEPQTIFSNGLVLRGRIAKENVNKGPLSQEAKEKFEKAGVDIQKMGNAKFTKNDDGDDILAIEFEQAEGAPTTQEIKVTDLEKQLALGQEDVLQIRSVDNTKVLFAYDKQTEQFLNAKDYLPEKNLAIVKNNEDLYTVIPSWSGMQEFWRRQELFLTPFDPENTYKPDPSQAVTDYYQWTGKQDIGVYNVFHPLGLVPTEMQSPFKFVNFSKIMENGQVDGYVVDVQVFNPSDNTFSVLHAFFNRNAVRAIKENFDMKDILLPQQEIMNVDYEPMKNFVQLYKKLDLIEIDGKVGKLPKINNMVTEWFTSGHMPKGLSNIPLSVEVRKIY